MLSGRFMSPLPPVSSVPDPETSALVSTKWNDDALSRTPLAVFRSFSASSDGAPLEDPHALSNSTAVETAARRRKRAMTFPPNEVRYRGRV
jgi:hypothetical protein